jgi:septum formation topological specificity factor MinE
MLAVLPTFRRTLMSLSSAYVEIALEQISVNVCKKRWKKRLGGMSEDRSPK